MRALIPFVLVAGCAGVGSDTVDATPTTPASQAVAATDVSRLGDTAGPVAGVAGFAFERTADTTRCGHVAVRVVRDPSVALADADQPLTDLLAVEYLRGLDFGDATRQASVTAFNAWLEDVRHRVGTAVQSYTVQLNTATDPQAQVIAAARLVQIHRYFAGLLVRAEIPIDMRSGEFADDKQDAFCDNLAEAAAPLLARADDAAMDCLKHAERLPAGWWTAICAH